MFTVMREWLQIIEEPTFGTAAVTPVVWPTASATAYYVPLVDSNSYSVTEEPVLIETPRGAGYDVVGEVVGDHRQVQGSMSTLGYPALAAFLLNLAITRSNGSTIPFVNAEPAGDLASVTILHGFSGRDGTAWAYGHSGMKVGGLELSCSRQDPRLKIKIDWVGSKETPNAFDSSAAPTVVAPTEAQLAKGPYLFSHTAANVKHDATAFSMYENLSIKVTNKPDVRWWEGHWPLTIGVYGREATADLALLLKGTPALRADYQAITSRGFSVKWDNGVNSLKVDFNGNNHINKLPFDLSLGKEFLQPTTYRNKWDGTAAADLTVTAT